MNEERREVGGGRWEVFHYSIGAEPGTDYRLDGWMNGWMGGVVCFLVVVVTVL